MSVEVDGFIPVVWSCAAERADVFRDLYAKIDLNSANIDIMYESSFIGVSVGSQISGLFARLTEIISPAGFALN